MTGSAGLPTEIAEQGGAHAACRIRRRGALCVAGGIPAGGKPKRRGSGPRPGPEADRAGKRNVAIAAIEPVGNYAVRLVFDDRHDTGIFSWDYLRELGQQHKQRWAAYLEALEVRGLSRGTG